jgi:hypothetical protein
MLKKGIKMEEGFFEYICEFWNEIDGKMDTVFGITYADSFTNAMNQIEKYYGHTIESVKLYGLEPSSVYELNNPTNFLITVNTKELK